MLQRVQHRTPAFIQKALVEVDSSFIMGGFINSCINNDYFSDIDIFCHYNDIDRFVSALGLDQEEVQRIQKDYSGQNSSMHVLKTVMNDIPIDLVSYNDDYNPSQHVDFYCRMIRYDGHNLYANDDISFHDVTNKILRLNSFYGMSMSEYYQVLDNVYTYCNLYIGYLNNKQYSMIKNITKYFNRGYTIMF